MLELPSMSHHPLLAMEESASRVVDRGPRAGKRTVGSLKKAEEGGVEGSGVLCDSSL